MRKKRVLAALLLFLAAMFSGCVVYDPEDNNLDTHEFYANFKADTDADSGKKAACFDGRIWYLSQESGVQGVHSMAADGSDVALEFAAEDVRSLTVRKDGIWYAGYAGMNTNSNGDYRDFRLYFRNTEQCEPQSILEGLAPEQQKMLFHGFNVWDAYVTPDGAVLLRCAYVSLPAGGKALEPAFIRSGDVLFAPYDEPYDAKNYDYFIWGNDVPGTNCRHDIVLVQKETLLLCESTYWGLGCNVYDGAENRIAFSNDLLFNNDDDGSTSPRYLFRVEDGWLYFTSNEEVLAFCPEPLATRQITTFTEPERIFGCRDGGDTLYVLTERWNPWLLRKLLGRADREALYRVDMETGKKTELLHLKPGAAFAYLDDSAVAVAEGKTLTVYDLSGATPEALRTVELSHKIVDKANKADAAGGWWFLYRFNRETNRDELIEKVRLFP